MTDAATRHPPVTVVIVTYQSRATIDATMAALQTPFEQGLLDCVVVDNASSDGTAGHVATAWPWATLVESGGNIGFGRGCNLGFAVVTTPYVLFLNPDAEIDTQALATMIAFMDAHPESAITAPATVVGDGALQLAGLQLTPGALVRAALGRGRAYPDSRPIKPNEPPFQTSWVCGAIMLIRADAFRAVGGFDPRYFLYFEETDLCLRLREAGLEIWALGDAVAQHTCGVSARASGESLESGCIAEHFYRSRYYYLVKHYGWVRATTAEVLAALIGWGKKLLKRIMRRSNGATAPVPKKPFLKMPEPVPEQP
jgi:GT2 family glycosyltransferase